jgi:translation initiation factor IF-2
LAKKKIFELAKELGVRSKTIVEKCHAEGLEDYVKTHMSPVSAGLEETIRDWFSVEDVAAEHTAVETTEHVDIEAERIAAEKERKRRGKTKAEQRAEAEAIVKAEEEAKAAAEAEAKAIADAEAKAIADAEAAVKAEEEAAAQAAADAADAAAEAEVADDDDVAEAEEAPEEPVAEVDAKDARIVPAGPQVVPKPAQLKGPRVIRVEKPDYAPRPTPRMGGAGGRPPVDLSAERNRVGADMRPPPAGAARKGGKGAAAAARRNPRRKGTSTRSFENSGEKLKEWRNADMAERANSIAGVGRSLHRRRATTKRGGMNISTGAKCGKVEIPEPITVKGLSSTTGIKTGDIIKKLMGQGILATINQTIDSTMAELVMTEFDIELVVVEAKTESDKLLDQLDEREAGELVSRAPVVTFLGHVDHGKTSLLDWIRKAKVATGEAGGITQAIGAYRHDMEDKHVVFLDTPGHEAFTAMRARGANMTDVVVLVCAADDGVMPQTVEAISHAKAAGVPIIVALNKIDVPNANPEKAFGQLTEHGLQPQEWGGETELIKTSAITGEGMDELMELLSMEAEMLELKAEVDAPASGYVVEARMDQGKGAVATLLNLNGTLNIGDVVVAGNSFGRVRQIYSDTGDRIKTAGPAMPVAIMGLDEVPDAGDKFYVVGDIEQARKVAESRRQTARSKQLAEAASAPKTLAEMLGKIEAGEKHEVSIILKADVQGSIEAITGSLEKINTDEVSLKVIHTAVGGITTGDVTLASASDALIIGFNVVADGKARKLAEEKKVEVKSYRVIYDIIDDMRRALEQGLAPELREEVLGQAEVRQTFKVSRLGTIAGCFVTEGLADRNAKVRIIRDSVVIEDERTLDSLKRIKDDAKEVKAGLECGIKLKGYDDIKEGDILEFYKTVEIARTL